MDLHAVMVELGEHLGTITGLNVFPYLPDSFTPPAAIVDDPEEILYHQAYGRGADRMTLPVWVVVGRVSDRASVKELAAYCDGSGAQSVLQALESGAPYTACDSVTVVRAEIDPITMNGVVYRAARFELDIIGRGA